jgi:hypothetical protein
MTPPGRVELGPSEGRSAQTSKGRSKRPHRGRGEFVYGGSQRWGTRNENHGMYELLACITQYLLNPLLSIE